jgi:Immunity protein Imm1
MKVKFIDMADKSNPLNGSMFQDGGRLLQILQGMQHREPFFCALQGENGFNLDLGVGLTCGCAQYSHIDGEPPYLMAVDANAPTEDGCKEFLCGNTPTAIPLRHCLPLAAIMEIAISFVETGKPSPAVPWEEI